MGAIAQSATDGQSVRLPHALLQPVAADDVANLLAEIAVGAPKNTTVELAGPEKIPLDELVRIFFKENRNKQNVVTDNEALYFGLTLNDQSLTPGNHPYIGLTHFKEWLRKNSPLHEGALP